MTTAEMVDLFREYEARLQKAEAHTAATEREWQRSRTLVAAFERLGRERGFTTQDARDAWKQAGYGGI